MIEIRLSEEKDVPGIVNACKESFKLHNIFSRSEEELEKYFKGLFSRAQILVAEEEGNIVGTVTLIIDQQTPEHTLSRIKHLAVLPDYRGKGVGPKLIAQAEQMIGKGKIEVHAAEGEINLVKFYENLGYIKEGELKSHYRKGETCFVFGKVLE